MTWLIVVTNSNSEEDHVMSSKHVVHFSPEWPPRLPPGGAWSQGCAGQAHMTFGCFLTWRPQLPKGSRGENRLEVNDLVETTFLPSLLGRTAVYAHYEEEPCRERTMTGEFSEQRVHVQPRSGCRGAQRAVPPST